MWLCWVFMRIVIVYWIGVVGVGEESVLVVVLFVYWKELFYVCEFLIDEFKVFVLIWKKEVYEIGDVWK